MKQPADWKFRLVIGAHIVGMAAALTALEVLDAWLLTHLK